MYSLVGIPAFLGVAIFVILAWTKERIFFRDVNKFLKTYAPPVLAFFSTIGALANVFHEKDKRKEPTEAELAKEYIFIFILVFNNFIFCSIASKWTKVYFIF